MRRILTTSTLACLALLLALPLAASAQELIKQTPIDGNASGLALGRGGEIFVFIDNDHRIARLTAAGAPREALRLRTERAPRRLAVDGEGQLFVLIDHDHRVVRCAPSGEAAGTSEPGGAVTAMTSDERGRVHVAIGRSVRGRYGNAWRGVADFEGTIGALAVRGDAIAVTIDHTHRVGLRVGDVRRTFEVGGQATAIALGAGNEVFININNSHRVARFSAEGEARGAIDTAGPVKAMAVDASGRLVTLETVEGRSIVRIYRP